MKAVETTGKLDADGKFVFDDSSSLPLQYSGQIKAILLYPEETEVSEEPYSTPSEEIEANLRQALREIKTGQTMSLKEMWNEFEAD